MAQAKKHRRKYAKMLDIYYDKVVYSQLLNLMDKKTPVAEILEFLADRDYPISEGTYFGFKKKLDQSLSLGVPMEDLLMDKRKQKKTLDKVKPDAISKQLDPQAKINEVDYANPANPSPSVPPTAQGELVERASQDLWTADGALEQLIKKGMNALEMAEYVDTPVMLKALDMYLKYFGDDRKGLTIEGLQQYATYMNTKINAMQEVLLEYVPEDKQRQAAEAMDNKQDEILANLELDVNGKHLVKAFKKAGLEL